MSRRCQSLLPHSRLPQLRGRAIGGGHGWRAQPGNSGFVALLVLPVVLVLVLPLSGLAAQDIEAPSTSRLRGSVLPKALESGAAADAHSAYALIEDDAAGAGFLPRLNYARYRYDAKPRIRVASLGPVALPVLNPERRAPAGPASAITWLATARCLPGHLKSTLATVAARYGHVTVNSTHRSRLHNKRVGGAKHSFHLRCQAVDFHVSGNHRATLAFLRKRTKIGGLKHYGGGVFHIDIGRRRSW